MAITPTCSSTVTYSSESAEDSNVSFPLQICELTEAVFNYKFKNCEELRTDEFEFSGTPDVGEIPSFTSVGVGDCITMFGIGDDGSLFAWHSSTVEDGSDREQTDKEIVLEELNGYFSERGDAKDLQFDIYLVGGNGSELSNNLYEGMIAAIPEFFTDAAIIGEFINPTKNSEKSFITANFNAKGELYYYFHDEQSNESSED